MISLTRLTLLAPPFNFAPTATPTTPTDDGLFHRPGETDVLRRGVVIVGELRRTAPAEQFSSLRPASSEVNRRRVGGEDGPRRRP